MSLALAALAPFLAAFGRCAAFLFAMPFTGDRHLAPRARLALAFVLAAALAPGRAPLGLDAILIALPSEILLGLAAGFGARMIVGGVEAGGQLIGQQLGLAFAATFDPGVGLEELPTTRLARVAFGLAFVGGNGLEASMFALATPAPSGPTLRAAAGLLIARGGDVLVAGVRLAAPVLAATLVANIAAAVASRAAPALNFFSVALALLLAVGFVVLAASAPMLLAELQGAADRIPQATAVIFGGG